LPVRPGLCCACAASAGCAGPNQGTHLTIQGIQVFVLNEFNDQIRQLVHMLKYQGKPLPGRLLGRSRGQCVSGHLNRHGRWVVVPVPLHSARKRERGFNQSAIIGRAVSVELGLECCEKVIKRVRNTRSQTQLDRQKRAQNVDSAFTVRQKQFVNERSVLLVDDVVTTGATLCACAGALRLAGAHHVVAAALARPRLGEDDLARFDPSGKK
jgi:ComF family protein